MQRYQTLSVDKIGEVGQSQSDSRMKTADFRGFRRIDPLIVYQSVTCVRKGTGRLFLAHRISRGVPPKSRARRPHMPLRLRIFRNSGDFSRRKGECPRSGLGEGR